MRPIVKPGTPWWVRGMSPDAKPPFTAETLAAVGVLFAVFAVLIALGMAFGSAGAGIVAAGLAAVGVLVPGTRAFRRAVVRAPEWEYEGVALEGDGLALLQDIGGRFEYAETVLEDLPAAIGAVDIRDDADRLLWEAAGLAARVSDIDRELVGLRYAAAGSAASALRSELQRTRGDYIGALRVIQRRAEDVASAAGEAAAAAALARERTGSVYEIEIVPPATAQAASSGGLDAARERLRLAAEVWSELDETTAIERARLDQERRQQRG